MGIFDAKLKDWSREEQRLEDLTISYSDNDKPFTKKLVALMKEVMRKYNLPKKGEFK